MEVQVSRFTENDFRRLNYDSTIIKVYDNKEGDVWYIRAAKIDTK